MLWCVTDRDGTITWIGSRVPRRGFELGVNARAIPLPDQPLQVVDREEATGKAGEIILGVSRYPDSVPKTFSESEITQIRAALVDKETEANINEAIHSFAPWGEQIGILRDQLVHVLNALGIEPTPEFARLNEIAIQEIEAARKKKGALDENDTA